MVSAINGTVTVKLSKAPETTPTKDDFKLTRSINGATAETVPALTFQYNAETLTATITVGEVAQAQTSQSIVYTAQFKETTAVSAPAFAVEALPQSAVKSVGYDVTAQTVTLIFDQPLNTVTASALQNYFYDNDRTSSTNTPVFPTSVALNSTAVGSIGANQIVTLTFAASTIAAGDEGSITVQNVKDAVGRVIPTSTTNVNIAAGATADAAAPTFAGGVGSGGLVSLTAGTSSAINGGTLTVEKGTKPTLSVVAEDDLNTVYTVEYRVTQPNGLVGSWTKLTARDGAFDEVAEEATATIDTTNWQPGNYTIAIRTVDSTGKITAAPASNITLAVAGGDTTLPVSTVTTTTYNATATATAPARSVSVTGTATDTNQVTKVEYRVREYNALTNTYAVVRDWSAATATDGTFNEVSEDYSFNTAALDAGKSYRIEVRTTDVAGNVSAVVAATPAIAAPITATAGLSLAGTFSIATDSTLPTITAAGTTSDGSALGTTAAPINDRTVQITGTAADTAPGVVNKVEYAIYRDSDANGTYDELVQNYSTTGVTADDGAFDEASEAYTANIVLPSQNGDYAILIRTVDNSGNISAVDNSVTSVIDVVRPTATVATNKATASNFDFVVTFNEGLTNASISTLGNFLIKNTNGDILTAAATAITPVLGTDNKQFVIEFGTAAAPAATLLTGNILEIVNVEDDAGNALNPNPLRFTIVNDNK